MPVKGGGTNQLPENTTNIWNPDVHPDDVILTPPIFAMAVSDGDISPADVANLTPEEIEKKKARYKYLGIRCRHDLKEETVPITRETMELP